MRQPEYVGGFEEIREAFTQYLLENGWQIYPPTNPYEVMRFGTRDIPTRIIYKNKHGRLSYVNDSWRSVSTFLAGRVRYVQDEGAERREVLDYLRDLLIEAGHDAEGNPTEKAQALFDRVVAAHHDRRPAKPEMPKTGVGGAYVGRI